MIKKKILFCIGLFFLLGSILMYHDTEMEDAISAALFYFVLSVACFYFSRKYIYALFYKLKLIINNTINQNTKNRYNKSDDEDNSLTKKIIIKSLDELDNLYANNYFKKNNDSTEITYCPNCGCVLENESICSNCNKIGISNKINSNFKDYTKDYAITLVLWGYEKPRKLPKSNKEIPYYLQECNISNITLFMKEIINKGYLRCPNKIELLELLKLPELKSILKNNNISSTGNKADLICKIVDNNIPVSIYNEKEKYYVLSNIGGDFLENNYDFIELHKNYQYQISLKEYYDIRKKLPKSNGYSFRDCAWNILNERVFKYTKTRDYQQLYFTYNVMGSLCYNEGKLPIAINFFIKCFIYEMCGVYYFDNIKLYKEGYFSKSYIIEYVESDKVFTNKTLNAIIDCKSFYNNEILRNEYKNIQLNYKLCSLELIEKLIDEAMNNSMFDLNDYSSIIKQEQVKNLKKHL